MSYDIETGTETEIYSSGSFIGGISVKDGKILFTDGNGLQVIGSDGQIVSTQLITGCDTHLSIHIQTGKCFCLFVLFMLIVDILKFFSTNPVKDSKRCSLLIDILLTTCQFIKLATRITAH